MEVIFNYSNTSVKASTPNTCVGESTKSKGGQVRNTKAFERAHAQRKSTSRSFKTLIHEGLCIKTLIQKRRHAIFVKKKGHEGKMQRTIIDGL